MLAKAIDIASRAFLHKKDKAGKPYILHCLHVMHEVAYLGEDAMISSVLHDIIEDTNWTAFNLKIEGFTDYQISIINLLTHDKEINTYDEYIKIIAQSKNKIAITIKLADLKHNSDITRLKGLSKKDFDRLEKYCRAYTYLKSEV